MTKAKGLIRDESFDTLEEALEYVRASEMMQFWTVLHCNRDNGLDDETAPFATYRVLAWADRPSIAQIALQLRSEPQGRML